MSTDNLSTEIKINYETPVTTGISWDDYMQRYAADHYEWRDGKVFKMSPVHEKHDILSRYLSNLIEAYLTLNPIGKIREEPFVMRLNLGKEKKAAREPDIQVILGDNLDNLTDTYMDGPADICMEIISPESVDRDYSTKFDEYQKAGVPEYWIIDPLNTKTTFYRLDEQGKYQQQALVNDAYTTPKLPKLTLHVPTLWQDPTPGIIQVVEHVKQMLAEDEN